MAIFGVENNGTAVSSDLTFAATLGAGQYRWEIYDRLGRDRIFAIHDWTQGTWARVRDDMSGASLTIPVQDCWANDSTDPSGRTAILTDYGQALADLRTFWHNLVIWREVNGVWDRVWEGPLTLIKYDEDSVTIEARDVMAWVYRRVILKGYDDSYPNVQSVVNRAQLLLRQEMGRDDPNVLPYLQAIMIPDDARETRIVGAAEKTLFQEIDDMAANSGLDYTVIGRRILLFDTHNAIGQLPDLDDRWFMGGITVTEYGMELATDSYVSSQNTGAYGHSASDAASHAYYGQIEHLVSPYGETTTPVGTSSAQPGVPIDPDEPAEPVVDMAALNSQAVSNLKGRSPAPVVIRVPDNSQLSPDTPLLMAQLVPGVWGRLRSRRTLRYTENWQKLDGVTVTVTPDGEQVQVSFSPAPGQGVDADLVVNGG